MGRLSPSMRFVGGMQILMQGGRRSGLSQISDKSKKSKSKGSVKGVNKTLSIQTSVAALTKANEDAASTKGAEEALAASP